MNNSKVCATCKQEKQFDEFYKLRSGSPASECKDCAKLRSKNQVKSQDRKSAVNYSEKIVIDKLSELGIPSLPGKALGYTWADVVAWGCVLIECKYSSDYGGEHFHWGFTPLQRIEGIRAHITILCCGWSDKTTYHLFEANDPIFYIHGKRKTGITYVPDATHGKHKRPALTKELMDAHSKKWGLIESYRKHIASQIMSGDTSTTEYWRVK
jgi:hypothetical protein